jgi:hypothetical protein
MRAKPWTRVFMLAVPVCHSQFFVIIVACRYNPLQEEIVDRRSFYY